MLHALRCESQWGIMLPFIVMVALLGTSCGSDDPSQPTGEEPGGYEASAALLFDGSHHPAIGAFHITDLRSRSVEIEGDTIDVYGAMEDYETRNLTVFHPHAATMRPVVVVVHGGAWTDGYMEWYAYTAESFTGVHDYVTVVLNYRLTSDEVFPTAICSTRTSPAPDPADKAAWYPDNLRDCADGLQWVVDHIVEYGGDPQSIFIFGQSAGAHLVSLLATHDDYATLRGHVQGVISMSGGYDLDDLNMAVFGNALELTFGTRTDAVILGEASPATYVVAGGVLPPFLVMYCELDLPSLDTQALAFSAQLTQLGYDVETSYLPGYDHVSEMQAIEFADAVPTQRIVDFIEAHLQE